MRSLSEKVENELVMKQHREKTMEEKYKERTNNRQILCKDSSES